MFVQNVQDPDVPIFELTISAGMWQNPGKQLTSEVKHVGNRSQQASAVLARHNSF